MALYGLRLRHSVCAPQPHGPFAELVRAVATMKWDAPDSQRRCAALAQPGRSFATLTRPVPLHPVRPAVTGSTRRCGGPASSRRTQRLPGMTMRRTTPTFRRRFCSGTGGWEAEQQEMCRGGESGREPPDACMGACIHLCPFCLQKQSSCLCWAAVQGDRGNQERRAAGGAGRAQAPRSAAGALAAPVVAPCSLC